MHPKGLVPGHGLAGEMPKWKVLRQVVMTHGFMHLGEVNAIKGQLGLQFSI